MNFIAAAIAAAIAAVVLGLFVLLGCLAGAAFGALTGWIVAQTPLGSMVLTPLSRLHLDGLSLAQVGACLGFVGPFLRSRQSTEVKK